MRVMNLHCWNKRCLYFSTFLLLINLNVSAQKKLPYRNASLPIETRTQDLLKRMTLEEKVGQLLCPLGWQMVERKGNAVSCSEEFKKLTATRPVGMLWAVFRADPCFLGCERSFRFCTTGTVASCKRLGLVFGLSR